MIQELLALQQQVLSLRSVHLALFINKVKCVISKKFFVVLVVPDQPVHSADFDIHDSGSFLTSIESRPVSGFYV